MKNAFFLLFFAISLSSVQKIELYVSFNCLYCNECLEVIKKYKEINSSVVVKICVLLNEKDEKSMYLISYVDDFNCFFFLMKYRFNSKFFYDFIEKNGLKISENAQKMIEKHQKTFKNKHINRVPTWYIDGIFYEGILDDMLNFLVSL